MPVFRKVTNLTEINYIQPAIDYHTEHWTRQVGIQPGTQANSNDSDRLDRRVGLASKLVFKKLLKEYNITYQSKLSKQQIPFGIGACNPDGGIWFIDDIPVLAIEVIKHH